MNNDAIIEKLLEHDKHFERMEENMVTKAETREIIQTLDGMMVILQRLDQERIFTQEWVRRIESDVEQSKKEISHLKKVLKVN